ncbi:MAG: cell division protein FtsZ [Bacteroidetes bacterium]|nr:MAG: cell division protein FtsZ [Bacteroidota bacterium]
MEKKPTYKFDYPSGEGSIIKVIGVGGGGSNAVNNMCMQGIKGVDFYICNTDIQALALSPVANKVQIGISLTKGLGAGANPEKGRNAALESKEDIRNLLSDNTKMVFITAGMGGGTGTGAAPVIAEISKELGILTVGIVTIPFTFEGKPKKERAEKGIRELRQNCDTVLIILNNKIKEVYGGATMKEAFGHADNVLAKAAKAIAEIITTAGTINVDFEDVRTVMQDSGVAVMGSAITEGDNRAKRAVEGALTSPLLNNTNIYGAKYILLSIVVGDEDNFQFEELEEITSYVQEQAGEEAEIIFGQATDPSLGQAIGVTVIATGFADDVDLEENFTRENASARRIYDLSSSKRIKQANKIRLEYDESNDFFDKPEPKVEKRPEPVPQPRNEKVVFKLEEDYKFPDAELEEAKKKRILAEQLKIRKEKIDSLRSMNDMSNDELQEKKEVPAYLRKNISLASTPHSSESHISRLKLNEENGLSSGNRFLHDNVD